MSDYFARLAERSLDAAPLPRPVIPSRFERPTATSLDEIEIEVHPLPPAAVRAAVDPETVATDPATNRVPVASTSLPPSLSGGREESAPSGDGRPLPSPRRDGPAPVTAQMVEHVTTRERERVVVERETASSPPPAAALRAHPVPVAPSLWRIEGRPVDAAPLPPDRFPSPERHQPAREPTVIHVTIDRVDVRAVSAPARPQERVRPQRLPRSSLEEYLRGDGGRP